MKTYDPFNWYWRVAGDAAKLYSSETGEFVPVEDARFIAWKEDGSLPTNIASVTELGEVLAAYSLRPVAADVLDAYLIKQANDIVAKPDFKPTFRALVEIANLKGETEPTVQTAVEWIKENAL
jgi:hypothetical protein